MKNTEKLAYYSHSYSIYNTGQERIEYRYIQEKFTNNIICPNFDFNENATTEEKLKSVEESDWVFISEYKGYVGKDSYKECKTALKNGIPLFALFIKGRDVFIKQVYDLKIISDFNPIGYARLIYL